jgi:hypothetical protein
MAALKLDLPEVPCIVLGHLTPTQRKAYVLADNQLALNSSWDDDFLKLELEELKLDGFDLEVLGFDSFKIKDGDLNESVEITGAKELSESDFQDFNMNCPRCGFEFDEKKE